MPLHKGPQHPSYATGAYVPIHVHSYSVSFYGRESAQCRSVRPPTPRRAACAETAVPTAAYVQRCADCKFARGTSGYHSNS